MEDHERLARLSPAAVSVQYDARMLMGADLITVSNCLAFLTPSSKIALVLPSGPHPVAPRHLRRAHRTAIELTAQHLGFAKKRTLAN